MPGSTGKKLANKLNCPLEALAFGSDLKAIEKQISPYGVDKIFIADDERLDPYLTLPHAKIATNILKEEYPQIVLL